MQFDSVLYLRKATSRAKSDVANKLISMLLHEISRRVVSRLGVGVTDATYAREVANIFGDRCAYCMRVLESDRAAVEHLDGMNRFRVGLHVPGNVVVSCKPCNSAKRLDDQKINLTLANSGWESFLSHDGSNCADSCKGCVYWKKIWPDDETRRSNLADSLARIRQFRVAHDKASEWSTKIRESGKARIDALYRECKESSHNQITAVADGLIGEVLASPVDS